MGNHRLLPALAVAVHLAFLHRPAAAQEFRPLFDGKTLSGLHLQGVGAWQVRDGMLVGTHAANDRSFGNLVSDSAYGDFTLRYRWKLVRGNSGLYIRSSEGGAAGMTGPQVEMDEAFPGGIYTTNTDPWGWVVQPKSSDIPKWYRPGDWNRVTVTAKGLRITVDYNGLRTAETSDPRLPSRGRFGFQAHADMDCEILVDDVEVAVSAPVRLAAPGPRAKGQEWAIRTGLNVPGAVWRVGDRAVRLDGRATSRTPGME
jgi:hypothetical protein